MAGRRKEKDERNELIDSYIKFIELVKPKVLFFENVKGFTIGFKKGNKRGKAYSTYVLEKLKALGYDVSGEIVNFSQFGVPQKRQRYILVGVKDGNSKVFFDKLIKNRAEFLKSKNLSDTTSLSDAISDLLMKNGVKQSPDTPSFKAGIYSESTTSYQKLMRQDKPLLNKVADSHRFANHKQKTIEKFKYILKNGKPNKNISDELKEKYNLKNVQLFLYVLTMRLQHLPLFLTIIYTMQNRES